jgi:hypothetical protein
MNLSRVALRAATGLLISKQRQASMLPKAHKMPKSETLESKTEHSTTSEPQHPTTSEPEHLRHPRTPSRA